MKTEDLVKPEKQTALEQVSPVLVDQLPAKCLITNERGDEANLTLAGYELNFGRTYHVRVSGPVQDLRLVGYPSDLVRRRSQEAEVDQRHQERFLFIPIRVGPSGIWDKIFKQNIYPHTLEIDVQTEEGKWHSIELPVILNRSRTWQWILFVMLWALIGYTWTVVTNLIWTNRTWQLTTIWPWFWCLILAIASAVYRLIRRFFQRRSRYRELKRQFLDRHRPAWSDGKSWKEQRTSGIGE